MISDSLYVEVSIYKEEKSNGDAYQTWISGLNGRFDMGLLDEFQEGLQEEPQAEIDKVIQGMKNGESTKLLLKLSYVEPETQYGTGYGDVMKLPSYYYVSELTVTP